MGSLATLVERGLMAPDWAEALAPVDEQVAALGRFLQAEDAAGRGYLPAAENVFRAFRRPLADVRVLVVGQDPYPTPGHPIGLSFAVDRDVWPLPKSLLNIYTELRDDLGVVPPRHGDLTAWSDQGVMLLNRALTVRPRDAGSHGAAGWDVVTDAAIDALVRRVADGGPPFVAVLWGSKAASLQPRLDGVPCVTAPHPSPLSAYRGFFGSKPFSRVDALLAEHGAEPVDWAALAADDHDASPGGRTGP